jgi:predicted PurR-regulated permease PerM
MSTPVVAQCPSDNISGQFTNAAWISAVNPWNLIPFVGPALPGVFQSTFGGPGWFTHTTPDLSSTLQQKQKDWQNSVTATLSLIQGEVSKAMTDLKNTLDVVSNYVPAYVHLALLPYTKYGVIFAGIVALLCILFVTLYFLTASVEEAEHMIEQEVVQDLSKSLQAPS